MTANANDNHCFFIPYNTTNTGARQIKNEYFDAVVVFREEAAPVFEEWRL